jgi:hypothetical protein
VKGTGLSELDRLKELLEESWSELEYFEDGFKNVDRIEGEPRRWTRTIQVITRGPSGQHYRWEYEEGLTENQEDLGPGEYYPLKIELVYPFTKTIEVTEWKEPV